MLSRREVVEKWVAGVALGAALVAMSVVTSDAQAAARKFLDIENAAQAQALEWQQTGRARTMMTDDGKVIFPYGQAMPTLYCSMMRICDVELEPGEKVMGKPEIGAPGTFSIGGGVSEDGAGNRIEHVIVKPMVERFDTNAVIFTDRRVYHMRFVSGPARDGSGQYVHRYGFYYPSDIVKEWEKRAVVSGGVGSSPKGRGGEIVNDGRVADLAVSPDRLDYAYVISGDSSLKPERVFNDGVRTYLQYAESALSGEAPALVVLDKGGQPMLVNMRRSANFMIIDKLFEKAQLILGDGSSRDVVNIRRGRRGWN